MEDWERANLYYERAAQAGYAPAMVSYALCLLHGEGTKSNEEEAMVWAVKAISTEDSYAVAFCTEFGLGVERDEQRAIALYGQSARAGFSAAQYRLGLLLTEDSENAEDMARGRQWLIEAARQGQALAQFELGLLQSEGDNMIQAAFWWQCAAKQGLVEALEALATVHFRDPNPALVDWGMGGALLCEAVRRTHRGRAGVTLNLVRERLELQVSGEEYEERAMELIHYGQLFTRGLPPAFSHLAPLPPPLCEPAITLYRECKARVVQVCCVLLGLRKKKQSVWAMLPRDMANLLCKAVLKSMWQPSLWVPTSLVVRERPRRSSRLAAKKTKH